MPTGTHVTNVGAILGSTTLYSVNALKATYLYTYPVEPGLRVGIKTANF